MVLFIFHSLACIIVTNQIYNLYHLKKFQWHWNFIIVRFQQDFDFLFSLLDESNIGMVTLSQNLAKLFTNV